MRNLEDIELDLAAAREALSSAEGTPAEVYSRIVGYYRSVRNWNRGKREEYGERQLYFVNGHKIRDQLHAAPSPSAGEEPRISEAADLWAGASGPADGSTADDMRLMLFVRSSCPGCPPARAAAGRLGVPVNLVNADTADGLEEAQRWNVLSTPMAILLSSEGTELGRAGDAQAMGMLPIRTDALNAALGAAPVAAMAV